MIHPLARASNPATSVDAACTARSLARAHRADILHALLAFGPATAERLAQNIRSLDKHQVGRRLIELERLGLARPLVENGRPVTHTLSTGRQGRVWVAGAGVRGPGDKSNQPTSSGSARSEPA